MNKLGSITAVLLISLGAVITIAPNAEAAVILHCNSIQFTNNAEYRDTYPGWTNTGDNHFKPDFNGNIYFAFGQQKALTGPARNQLDTTAHKVNTNCGLDWSQSIICPNNEGDGTQFQCVYSNPVPDPAGGVTDFSKLSNSDGGGTIISQSRNRLNPETGTVFAELPAYDLNSANYFHVGRQYPTDGDAYILGGKVYTIHTQAVTSSIKVFDDDSHEWSATYPVGTSLPVTVTTQSGGANPYAFLNVKSSTGTATEYRRLDLVAQTFSAALQGNSAAANIFSFAPMQIGQAGESASVYGMNSGSTGTRTFLEKINIAAWTTTSETEFLLGGLAFNPQANPTLLFDWDLDGANNVLLCGGDLNTGTLKLWKVAAGDTAIVEIYSEAKPSGWSGLRADRCKFDYNGGFRVMALGGCTGPGAAGTTSCAIHKRFLNNDIFTNKIYPKTIDTTIYADLGDGGGPLPTATNNPIGAAVDYFAVSWGIDFAAAGALFALSILGFLAFRLKGMHTIIIATVMFVGVEFCIRLALLPDWLRFVEIFLIIAVAAHQLFERRAQAEEGGE